MRGGEAAQAGIAAAGQLYFEGKTVGARQGLVAKLNGPDARDPPTRLAVLGALLDICIHSRAAECVETYAPQYVALARTTPAGNAALDAEQARRAAYYFGYGRLLLDRPEVTARILEEDVWKRENAYDGELYLQRQLLAARVLLAQDQPERAIRAVDKTLSLIATLKNPQDSRFIVAFALAESLATLLELGERERAFGLYRASGDFIGRTLGARTPDGVAFHATEAALLEEVGDLAGADRALAAAVAGLETLEVDPDVRDRFAGRVLAERAMICALRGEMACAREAVRSHPLARLYAEIGRTPSTFEEVNYLAARALVGAVEKASDRVAADALQRRPDLKGSPAVTARASVARATGLALAQSPGPAQAAALKGLGAELRTAVAREKGPPGAWYRPGAVDAIMLAVALSQAETTDPETAFALFQIAGRSGPTFDADALTAISQAKTATERRSVHEALRLRARRDRLERTMIQAVVAQAMEAGPGTGPLQHDPSARIRLRDFAERMAEAERGLAKAGVSLSGANLTPLKAFQATLAPGEAALAVTPAVGGLAYMCVRRDSVVRRVGPANLTNLRLDTRLLQVALSATYAPSATLDAQFPAEASVRLYDALIRPFEACLKPHDHILWLSSVSFPGVPLAALLPAPPPMTGAGYDLGHADWLARRHAISYAGSASVVMAARSRATDAAAFDFLGVGDPLLTGVTAEGQARGKVVMRGVRGTELAELAPLPETREELEASAKGFHDARTLLGAEATERAFRGQLVGAYKFLSFATHGLIRDDLQGLSEPALVLTPVSETEPSDNGLLTASEIADLNLTASFVALSACNTANFDLGQAAQDLPALASAFSVAGAPSTLATLWPVNSEASKRIVAATFAGLRAKPAYGPAEALADAQRAFLANPPGSPYLHPRFWAPFVVLGDGGTLRPDRPGLPPKPVTVEVLTHTGGEVLALGRGPGGVAVRFVSDADEAGRHGAGSRMAASSGQGWRRDSRDLGASRFLIQFDGVVVTSGYEPTGAGGFAPVLEAADVASGQPVKAWHGPQLDGTNGFILAGAADGRGALIAVGDALSPQRPGAALRVLRFDAQLNPRPVFETATPVGTSLTDATLTVSRGDLLLTFTDRYARPAAPLPATDDDYDSPACFSEPVTWIELRDGRTGALKASREIRGLAATTSLRAPDGRILLGGAARSGCGDAKAMVALVSSSLQIRTIYADEGLGASDVRALSVLPDGRLFVAASKETVVDYRPPAPPGKADPFRMAEGPGSYGAMALILRRDGAASSPQMLDSGSTVFVDAADASDPGDILLGGSLGGEAAIFHLKAGPPPRPTAR